MLISYIDKVVIATVASESLSAFNDLKLSKRSKFIIFALSPEKTPIVVDKTRALNGFTADIQGMDIFEVAYDPVLERVSRGAGSH
ncbi:hypothetical protein OY671_005636 [Metschnikowia pulcherrima]|nr:hypothetical protein OY671_005636 [Metschnikowia pulcherrima]